MKQLTLALQGRGFSLGLCLLSCSVIGGLGQDTNNPSNQPITVYQNTFDAGTNSLAGFTAFGRFGNLVQVTNGLLEPSILLGN